MVGELEIFAPIFIPLEFPLVIVNPFNWAELFSPLLKVTTAPLLFPSKIVFSAPLFVIITILKEKKV